MRKPGPGTTHYVIAALLLVASALTADARGAAKTVHLTVWSLPRPEDTGIWAKSDRAVIQAFLKKYPHIRLSSPTGIAIPEMSAMDTRPLMAIAGGVSPDVIYVNFRQSDTYIQEGFLYPLDKWVEKLSKEELDERLRAQVRKVVFRWGPGKKTGEDTDKHYWCLPYGNSTKALVWRKDLFLQAGLKPDVPPDTWQEYYEFAQKCTDPDKGTYGILMGEGAHWSWYFYSILCSAGAKVMEDRGEDEWVATFNSPQGVAAYEFLLKLLQGKWRHPSGKIVEGVVYQDIPRNMSVMWNSGRVGMMEVYLTDNMLTRVNPDLMGIAPVPAGPGGRASELNCPMAGIFSGAAKKGPEVLDAAWKYVHFLGSPEARAIRTRILVKNGYGMFASPEYLKKLGYKEYLRRVPETWRRTFREAMENGEPEPYGRNCQNVYTYTTWPADKMVIEGLGRHEFDAVEAARKHLTRERPDISEGDLQAELEAVRQRTRTEVRRKIKAILDEYAARANEKMIGEVPPAEMRKRRIVALIVVAAIAIAFLALFVYIAKVFTPKGVKGRWMFRKHWLAYLLLIPALATIALWRYIPMIRGAVIAFQDYHIVWDNMWVGLDNFANTLWDAEFWNALVLSVWYVILAIGLGFFAPIFLAILLHEVPKGKILFRTLYYLPAVLSGLVVMLMWKGFFEPSKRGLLNQVVTSVPPWLAFGVGALITLGFVAASCFYFRSHRKVGGWVTAVLAAAVGVGTVALGDWASASMAEQRWELAGVAALGAVVLAVNCRFAFRRGSRFWGWASLVAAVTMGVTIVLLWRWQWAALPAAAQRWLKDPRWAMFCVVLPTAWAGMGPGCLIYLAALKTIPEDLYEAADLDGAGFFSKAWHITVPMIKVLIIINFIGAVVNAFRVSGYILAMTGGGPAGATEVLALKIFFDAFVHLRFGMATATAWLMGAMLIGFTVFQMRRLSRVEFRTAGR